MNAIHMTMKNQIRHALAAFLVLMALAIPVLAGEVETRTDTQSMREGDTFQLLLRYRGDAPSRPDTSALEGDFEVLSMRQSDRTSVVNGVRDDSLDWVLTLAPRRVGVLSVPALTVGDARSAPFEVRVQGQDEGDASSGPSPIMIEVEVDDESPYVQEKVLLTARLFLDESTRDGAVTEPELEGAIMERTGEDKTSTVTRNGKRYTMIERRYALFPQESGHVVVPPITFEATQRSSASGGRRGSRFGRDPFAGDPFFSDFFGGSGSPFGSSMLDDFFDRGSRVRARSKPIELDVQPKPDEAAGKWWLPARHVKLVEEWEPEPPVFRVGDQVKRRIAIQAIGLSGSQMPELDLPPVEGLKQYPQPSLDDTLVSGDETVAVKLREFDLLPTRSGELVLPEVEVAWWDVEAEEMRTASLPERKVQVLEADGSVAAPSVSSPDESSPGTDHVSPSSETPGSAGSMRRLPMALGAGLALMLVGLGVVLRRRSAKDGPAPAVPVKSLHSAERELKKACSSSDPRLATAAVLAIGRARWPEAPPSDPAGVAGRLQDGELEAAIDTLMRARFSESSAPWDGSALWRAYSKVSGRRRSKIGSPAEGPLPALYPAPKGQEPVANS